MIYKEIIESWQALPASLLRSTAFSLRTADHLARQRRGGTDGCVASVTVLDRVAGQGDGSGPSVMELRAACRRRSRHRYGALRDHRHHRLERCRMIPALP